MFIYPASSCLLEISTYVLNFMTFLLIKNQTVALEIKRHNQWYTRQLVNKNKTIRLQFNPHAIKDATTCLCFIKRTPLLRDLLK